MWENLGTELSAGATVISAILIVVVLIIAFSIRKKIVRTERDNEFLFWGKEQGGLQDLTEEEDSGEDEYEESVEEDDNDYEENDETE